MGLVVRGWINHKKAIVGNGPQLLRGSKITLQSRIGIVMHKISIQNAPRLTALRAKAHHSKKVISACGRGRGRSWPVDEVGRQRIHQSKGLGIKEGKMRTLHRARGSRQAHKSGPQSYRPTT
jgi:hypothetical protein